MSYHQLTEIERYQIHALLKVGRSISEIANQLNRHKSSISREIKRNTGLRGYRPRQAHLLTLARRRLHSHSRISDELWDEVVRLVREDWSPEQIAWRLYDEQGACISHEWIYQYIYQDKLSGGDLYCHLRCQKRRKKRYGTYDKRGQIVGRVSIDERPAIVEDNTRRGDWEGDTVEGAHHQGYLLTLVERKSKYLRAKPLQNKTAKKTSEAMIESLTGYDVETVTLDNGKEFADHKSVSVEIKADVYFADPYSSWQRGLNENTNGLLRQYYPKGMSLKDLDEEQLEAVVTKLNNRPRKALDWLTPHEVMFGKKTRLTSRVAVTS